MHRDIIILDDYKKSGFKKNEFSMICPNFKKEIMAMSYFSAQPTLKLSKTSARKSSRQSRPQASKYIYYDICTHVNENHFLL